ncbi:hypothetical protein M0802_016597 [Mischocyttarus mexicanus]|nr:hypothetical protein M0802_016597 [Mischocyttarus mexicanus]
MRCMPTNVIRASTPITKSAAICYKFSQNILPVSKRLIVSSLKILLKTDCYLLNMYVNVGGIIIIIISCFSSMATALLGYDCGGTATNITTVSLLEVGECNIPTTKPNRTTVYLQLLQLIDYETTQVFQCRVEVDRTIYYCGMSSHISAVQNGHMYVNVGGIIIIIISCFSSMATALLGYDCGGTATNITTVSLLEVGECNIPTTKPNRTTVYLQLLQLIDYETTQVFQCRVEVDRTIYYCGMSSHISAVQNGRRLYLWELSREVCRTLIDTGSISINSFTHLNNIRTNTTSFRSITLAGTLTSDGQCSGTQYSDTDGTWNNVVVQATVKISTKTYTGQIKIKDDIISLHGHLQCPFSKGSCFTDENGNAYWSLFPKSSCNFEHHRW